MIQKAWGRGVLVLLGCLVVPAAAQDEERPFRPSNEEVDRELDRSLERAYDEDHPPPPEAEPARPTKRERRRKKDDDGGFRLRLGGYAAHYAATFKDVELRLREGSSGGERIRLDERDAVADFDVDHGQLYKAWIDLGKHVSITGGFRRLVARESQQTTTSFTFGRTHFAAGQRVETLVDNYLADLDLVVKPINNRWVSLDLHLGSRYVFWETRLTNETLGPLVAQERSRLEGAMPMVGAGIAVRPLRQVELFARARVGYMGYDRPESHHYSRRNGYRHVEAKEKEVKSAELDVGLSITFFDHLGVLVGYRLDHVSIEREVRNRTAEVEGTVHGLYAGVLLEF